MSTLSTLNVGSSNDDGTGESLRDGMIKCNNNFSTLNTDKIEALEDDTAPVLGGNLDVGGNAIISTSAGNIPLTPDGAGRVVIDGIIFNLDGGSNGQVLKFNGTDTVSFQDDAVGSGATGLANVVEDLSPQLGANLDVNGFGLVSASNSDIPITPNGSGSVILDGLSWPQADGTAGQTLVTDGSGQLSFASAGGGDMTAAVYDPTGVADDAFDRANHTGTQLLATISDAGTLAGANDAGDVGVAATPTNYSVGSADVEAHLAGVDTAIGLRSRKLRDKNRQTGTSYTLALVDNGALVTMDNGSANTVTIPLNATVAFAYSATDSTQIDIIQKGAGVTTIDAVSGVTLNGVDGGSCSITARFGAATLIKDDEDSWWVVGNVGSVA